MKLVYITPDHCLVGVTLDEGETLGNFSGKTDETVQFNVTFPSPTGKEYEEIKARIDAGDIVIAPYEPPPAPVPASVFDYQFAGEAEARGIIAAEECDAWVGPGVVPQTLLTKVEQIITDPDTQRRVVLFLKGSKEFPRFHPNTVALAKLFGLDTDAALDDFFIAAAQR